MQQNKTNRSSAVIHIPRRCVAGRERRASFGRHTASDGEGPHIQEAEPGHAEADQQRPRRCRQEKWPRGPESRHEELGHDEWTEPGHSLPPHRQGHHRRGRGGVGLQCLHQHARRSRALRGAGANSPGWFFAGQLLHHHRMVLCAVEALPDSALRQAREGGDTTDPQLPTLRDHQLAVGLCRVLQVRAGRRS